MSIQDVRGVCNLVCIPAFVTAQVIQSSPPFWVVLFFWIFALTMSYTCVVDGWEWRYLPGAIGSIMNCACMLANGGKMPVRMKPWMHETYINRSVWRTALPSDHLLFLSDRFAGFSLGDIVIGIGILFMMAMSLRRRLVGVVST